MKLEQRNLDAANYFDKLTHEHKYELMSISSIIKLPSNSSDLDHFNRTCQMLFASNKASWITECLKIIPHQLCLSNDDFFEMTD